MINTNFTYDGITSESMGLSIVRVDSGLPSVPYTSGKEILETHPNKSLYPYFFGVKHQPLQFTVTFSTLEKNMDSAKLYELANWLFQNKYKPFISLDNPSRIYYCIATNPVEFATNGLEEGYFTVDFRCRDGFGWTIPTVDIYDLSGITSSTPLQITNFSNVLDYYYPEVEFELQSTNTGVSLINNSDGGREFKFTGLTVGESVYIDNQKRVIVSDVSSNRFDKFNKNFFRLKKGVNHISVTGKCILKIKMTFPVFN